MAPLLGNFCFQGNVIFRVSANMSSNLFVGGKCFVNKKIIMFIDNSALVSIVNRQLSKSKRVMMLIRRMVLLILRNNIIFKAQHIIGKENNIAESLSRKQFHRFRKLAPEADKYPESLPEEFLAMMSEMK